MDRNFILAKLDAAKRDVTAAEAEIEELLQELRIMQRAEKVTISAKLEGAFSKLRAARLNLESVETSISSDEN